MQWILSYPVWTIFATALLAAGLTFLLYKSSYKNFEVAKSWIGFMAFLRWTALFLIGLLLLNPLIKNTYNEKVSPIIISIQDQTASIPVGLDQSELKDYQHAYRQEISKLSKKFEVKEYGFETELLEIDADSNSFSGKGTDIDKALTQAAQRNISQHIGAVILSSDGIYNQGVSPIYNTSFAGIPIYTIALGDTTTQIDMRVQRLRYSDLVYLGDDMEVLVDLGADYLNGKSVSLKLEDSRGNVLKQQEIKITNREWNQTIPFIIEAQRAGIHRYKITTTVFQGERVTANNQQEFYIQVIDGRQKVLMLYDAPHPDIKFIQETLSEMKNIELHVSQIDKFKETQSDFDLLILHGLPAQRNKSANNLLQRLTKKANSVWWIYSTGTDISTFNQMQALVKISNTLKVKNEIFPSFVPDYQKFYVSDYSLKWLSEAPPLLSPYGQLELAPFAEICWRQKIGQVATSQALLATGEQNQQTTAVLLGEGIWRWPMQEFFKYGEKIRSREWVERLVQYISDKSDHRSFRIKTNKTIYNETEWIYIDASIYNETGQLVNTEDVKVVISDNEAYKNEIVLDRAQNGYTYNLGQLPKGTYQMEATSKLGTQSLKSEYRFAVQAFDIETNNIKADYSLMNTIALQHNAQMLHYTNVDQLSNMILQDGRLKPVFKEFVKTNSLIHLKWILALIVGLLAVEWFLRKFFGGY